MYAAGPRHGLQLVAEDAIYGLLHNEGFSLFPDEVFADLFTDVGRRSVPPLVGGGGHGAAAAT